MERGSSSEAPAVTDDVASRPGKGARRLAAAAAVAAAIAVAACGSSSSSSSSATSTASGSASNASASTDPGVTHAQQVVAQDSSTVSNYDIPTTPIKNVSALKGKTVFYIPLLTQIPAFAIVGPNLQQALNTAGITTRICNGQANPTGVAACVQQAISAHASAIVTDAVPYEMAANAFAGAVGKGVKVLIADQNDEPNRDVADKLAYQPGVTNQAQVVADWIIADSKGHANVIVGKETDNPTSAGMVTQGLVPEFKQYCSGCQVTLKPITASTPDQLASDVNSNVLKDPGVQYYYTEFEDSLQGTLQGIQQSGKINSIKVEAASGSIAGLQKLKSGQAVDAELLVDLNYEAWADADEVLRMLAGQPTVQETTPERLFTRQNINTVTLTPAAQATGEWFGDPNAFKAAFKKAWGVSG
ncbi:MAG TPA: substrate-binding domain-containing protein [Solirubrobacteraceae bacterium]|nr:substrate-binding domain-containing protein [Solirubrobacteraceae bacterium]